MSKYGVDWPTEPEAIIREALREYVGDGEGADELVLADYLAGLVRAISMHGEYVRYEYGDFVVFSVPVYVIEEVMADHV